MAGHSFDLQSSLAAASGVDPLLSCCRSLVLVGVQGGIFFLVVLLLFLRFGGVWFFGIAGIIPHYAVRASFSVVIGGLGFVCPLGSLSSGLVLGSFILPSGRFRSLVSVVPWLVSFVLILGLGMVRLSIFSKDASVSRVVVLQRRLGCVPSVLDGISKCGLTLSRDLELSVQWDAIVSAGPCGPFCSANLAISLAVGLPFFGDHVRVLCVAVADFLYKVVVRREDVAVRGWRSWMLEDDKDHLYRWLTPDLVALAPFLCCDPRLIVVVLFLILIVLYNFCLVSLLLSGRPRCRCSFCLLIGRSVVGSLVCVKLIYLFLWALIFIMLSNINRLSASCVDGWGWRDFKASPEVWFDKLTVVLPGDDLDGVWPEGLLDAHVTMIPKTDGDAASLGQRPLCVVPVVYRTWASVTLRHLDGWLRSWLPLSVFSAGGGRRSVDAWCSTALDFEEVLSCLSESHFMSLLLLVWLSLLKLLIVVFWIWFLGVWVFRLVSLGSFWLSR